MQGLRSSATTLNDLANGIAAVGAELTERSVRRRIRRRSRWTSTATSRDLNPVVREEAYRIAGEALRNAFKHAQARRIIVTIHYEARQLRVTIRDDGKGMDEETMRRQQPPGHFGLPGMRERAAIVRRTTRGPQRDRFRDGDRAAHPGAIAYGRVTPGRGGRGSARSDRVVSRDARKDERTSETKRRWPPACSCVCRAERSR